MIHAYLFVTQNRKDREDHGPEFHKHMHRINKEAGTNITVSSFKLVFTCKYFFLSIIGKYQIFI